VTNQTDRKLRLSEEIARTTRGSDKPYEIRDRGGKQSQPNLLLRVQPSGAKAYYFQAGRGRRILLGRPPLMTLAQARMAAASAAGRSADGVDVVAEVRNERVTLGDFIEGDWWKYAEDRIASADRIKVVLLHSFADLLAHPMVIPFFPPSAKVGILTTGCALGVPCPAAPLPKRSSVAATSGAVA